MKSHFEPRGDAACGHDSAGIDDPVVVNVGLGGDLGQPVDGHGVLG